jgi:hypothetical protein
MVALAGVSFWPLADLPACLVEVFFRPTADSALQAASSLSEDGEDEEDEQADRAAEPPVVRGQTVDCSEKSRSGSTDLQPRVS